MERVFIDYYKLLGLRPDASDEEIREIYRKAMIECHPDLHTKSDEKTQRQAENAARLLNEMRETLLNPEKRKAYDAERKAFYESMRKQEENNEEYEDRYHDDPYEEDGEVLTPEEAFEKIKEAYQKAREEEKAYPISERHKDIAEEYKATVGTAVENSTVRAAGGIGAHIAQEIVYQLSKLRHRKGESFLDYSMRNRRNIAAFLVGFSIFAASVKGLDGKEVTSTETTQVTDTINNEEQTQLTRYYTIKDGDNLSVLAYNAGISIEKLQKINDIKGQIIYTGDQIRIPYNINESDLYYYTEVIDVEGRSLREIADLYETDIATLKRLNTTAIGMVDGSEDILTSQVFVPKFIERDMLQVLKVENENQNKLA